MRLLIWLKITQLLEYNFSNNVELIHMRTSKLIDLRLTIQEHKLPKV